MTTPATTSAARATAAATAGSRALLEGPIRAIIAAGKAVSNAAVESPPPGARLRAESCPKEPF